MKHDISELTVLTQFLFEHVTKKLIKVNPWIKIQSKNS